MLNMNSEQKVMYDKGELKFNSLEQVTRINKKTYEISTVDQVVEMTSPMNGIVVDMKIDITSTFKQDGSEIVVPEEVLSEAGTK
ncbi:DUF6612 family protein [Mechercharimyces sp. CAU 1602]|uniref:DUF6612 family protein n=1 Tax=Mechercharimyces sp. CAU 1602 TaxID=2973933 RepID=UPI0021623769|nr:DUF6612 family protein [Mechercharimyces sp. CAU 1602]